MSNQISYDDALKFFQSHELYWEALLNGLEAKRESYIADLKRNAETPTCDERADSKAIGGMLAADDLIYDFKLPIETDSQ